MKRHNLLKQLSLPYGGIFLSIGLIQTQPESLGGLPIGTILIGALVVIVFAVIWVLYEEGKASGDKTEQPQAAGVAIAPGGSAMPAAADRPEEMPPPAQVDELTLIEGIGPKISGVLRAAGITTFAQLGATEVSRLTQILREVNLSLADPTTWPEQARLAAAGNWETLQSLQDELKGGRRT